MVTTIYYCDICQSTYKTEDEASHCEKKGNMRQLFPIGTIFKSYHDKMVFVVAGFHGRNHYATYTAWGFRDTDVGDNSPKNKKDVKNPSGTCGFECYRDSGEIHGASEPDKKLPCYKRAVKLMKRLGVKPIPYKHDVKGVLTDSEDKV